MYKALGYKRRIGGLVRSSCQEPHQTVPSFEFALQSIKSMKGTNQRRDERVSPTSRVTMAFGIPLWVNGIMWPFRGVTDSLIRTEGVWIPTSCLMWIIKCFQHVCLPFHVFSPLWRETHYISAPLKSQLYLLVKIFICSDSLNLVSEVCALF